MEKHIKHFEQPQFISIHFNNEIGQCDSEHHYSRSDAESYVRRMMPKELEKCKSRFPEEPLKHTINYVEIHDCLNRSDWHKRIDIDINGLMTAKMVKNG